MLKQSKTKKISGVWGCFKKHQLDQAGLKWIWQNQTEL